MSMRFLSVLVALFAAQCAFATPDLDREMVLTPPSGDTPEDHEIARWQLRAGGSHATAADFERLGWAYVAKARRTLDAGYFELTLRTADVLEAHFGASDSAALLRGHAFHNLHRFHEAEGVARKLVAQRGSADDFALLSDALMEQGRLGESIPALQHAADLRPGAEVDTRIAHLRWLKGDIAGAVRAMESAVRETAPTDGEQIAWMLAQLSGFELQRGNVVRAEALAKSASQHVADFAPALLARGRVALAANDVPTAVDVLRRAAQLNPLPEYQWWLADALRASGSVAEADAMAQKIIASGEASDPRTTAIYLATARKDVPAAVRLARRELANRADVQTRDATSWALYAAGELAGAETESRLARTEGTRDPRLQLHAAVIELANGHAAEARTSLSRCEPAALLPSERALYAATETQLRTNDVAAASNQGAGRPVVAADGEQSGRLRRAEVAVANSAICRP